MSGPACFLISSMGGLRWYKNRVVVNYDADGKKIQTGDRDADRRVLTMSYVTTGRYSFSESVLCPARPTSGG